MKYPSIKGDVDKQPPLRPVCPVCKKRKAGEPHSMAIFSGGTIYMGKRRGIPDELEGYVKITWHGAHDTGKGKDRDIYTSVDVAEDVIGGQFDICFCSTSCLRKFFSGWVDALDAKIKREKKKQTKTTQPSAAPNRLPRGV